MSNIETNDAAGILNGDFQRSKSFQADWLNISFNQLVSKLTKKAGIAIGVIFLVVLCLTSILVLTLNSKKIENDENGGKFESRIHAPDSSSSTPK